MTGTNETDQYFTPGIDPNKPLPDLGQDRIASDRFSSRETQAQEWRNLWRMANASPPACPRAAGGKGTLPMHNKQLTLLW